MWPGLPLWKKTAVGALVICGKTPITITWSSAATNFYEKSLDPQKNSLDLKQTTIIYNFGIEMRSFAWNDLIIDFIA